MTAAYVRAPHQSLLPSWLSETLTSQTLGYASWAFASLIIVLRVQVISTTGARDD